jgi:hypothetical protein
MGERMYKIIYKSTRKMGFVAMIVLLHGMYAICYIAICDIRTNCDCLFCRDFYKGRYVSYIE